MKIVRYLFLTLIIVLGFTFACLNTTAVSINYYIGTSLLPLSLLLIMTFAVGMIIAMIFNLAWVVQLKRKNYLNRQKIKRLEQELSQKNLTRELGDVE